MQIELQDYTSATRDFSAVLSLSTKDAEMAEANVGLAGLKIDEFPDEANIYVGRALSLNPSNAMGHYYDGELKAEAKQHEQAIAAYTKAINSNNLTKSYEFYAYNGRAVSHDLMGKNDKAIADYTKAIALKPDDYLPYRDRSFVNIRIGRNNDAIQDCDNAIRLNPDDVSYSNRGRAKAALGKYEEAIKDYNEAIKLDSDGLYYYIRGRAKAALGKYEEAIRDYDEAIKLNPDGTYAHSYYVRGEAKQALKRYDEAIEDYSQAIKLNPNDEDYSYNIARGKARFARRVHQFFHLVRKRN